MLDQPYPGLISLYFTFPAAVSVESIGTKLNGLLKDAESRIHDLSGPEGLCPPVFTSRPSISSIIIGEYFNGMWVLEQRVINVIPQAIRALRSRAAPVTRWTSRLASGNVVSRGCDACYWAGTRRDHQMRPLRLWSMSSVTIPSVCRFLSRSRVPLAQNSKVNNSGNVASSTVVVNRSRG